MIFHIYYICIMSIHTYQYIYIYILYELMDLNIFDVLQFISTIILTDILYLLFLMQKFIHFGPRVLMISYMQGSSYISLHLAPISFQWMYINRKYDYFCFVLFHLNKTHHKFKLILLIQIRKDMVFTLTNFISISLLPCPKQQFTMPPI